MDSLLHHRIYRIVEMFWKKVSHRKAKTKLLFTHFNYTTSNIRVSTNSIQLFVYSRETSDTNSVTATKTDTCTRLFASYVAYIGKTKWKNHLFSYRMWLNAPQNDICVTLRIPNPLCVSAELRALRNIYISVYYSFISLQPFSTLHICAE